MKNITRNLSSALIVILALASIIFFRTQLFYEIESYEKGVMIHFGKADPIPKEVGWHFKLPSPLQKILIPVSYSSFILFRHYYLQIFSMFPHILQNVRKLN